MKYPVLTVADLHLTSKPADDYRWGIFNFIISEVRINNVKEVYILGDITDSKDRHNSLLVNRLVGNLSRIAMYVPVKIIKGNHDYIDEDNPFMEFLNNVPNIEFYSTWNNVITKVDNRNTRNILFLPHTRNHNEDWAFVEFGEPDFIFMHQTVNGSKAANGFEMETGMSSKYFRRKVYSGDVHIPQIIGDVEYIGAPYPIRFGDTYKARCLLLDLFNGKTKDLYYKTINKYVLDLQLGDEIEVGLQKGDMVKVRLHLKKSEYHEWEQVKKEYLKLINMSGATCESFHVKELVGKTVLKERKIEIKRTLKDEDVLERYSQKEKLGSECLEAGKDYL